MKVPYTFIAIAGLASVAHTQDTGPSPTNSVGCEPHSDHWHCDGPASTPVTVASSLVTNPTSSTLSFEDHDHDHEHEHENEHGHDEAEHEHAAASGTLAPSPTESVGCEPHGDHWHCDGPAAMTIEAATGTLTIAPSPTESMGCEPHGDHWHCDGPAVASSPLTSVAANRTVLVPSSTASSTLIPSNGAAVHDAGHGFVTALLVLAGVFAL